MSAFNNIAQNTYSANRSVLDASAMTGDDEQISEAAPVIRHISTGNEPYQRGAKTYHKNPQPIIIASGDMNGYGKEYRYPLGPGMNCQVVKDDG